MASGCFITLQAQLPEGWVGIQSPSTELGSLWVRVWVGVKTAFFCPQEAKDKRQNTGHPWGLGCGESSLRLV